MRNYNKKTHSVCKHCKTEFDLTDKPGGFMANHSRWCDKNPKRAQYLKTLSNTRDKYITEETRDKMKLGISKAWKEDKYKNADFGKGFRGKKHTEESKAKISEAALNSNHRRLRRNPIEYNGFLLDSTWELELAKRLDSLNIKWERPEPLPYTTEDGKTHRYFPDFYLPEYDLYVDPKNQHACSVQSVKLEILNNLYPNILIIKTLEECKNFTI